MTPSEQLRAAFADYEQLHARAKGLGLRVDDGRLANARGFLARLPGQFPGRGSSDAPAEHEIFAELGALRLYSRVLGEKIDGATHGEPFCACGRRWADCDGSRLKCHKRSK